MRIIRYEILLKISVKKEFKGNKMDEKTLNWNY